MAVGGIEQNAVQIQRFPQSNYVDAVRWLPPLSAFDRFAALALFDSDSDAASVEIYAVSRSNPPNLDLRSSWSAPSRISSLRVSQTPHKPLLGFSTFAGSLHVLVADCVDASIDLDLSSSKKLHQGPITCIDLQGSEGDCIVSVGEDGRVTLAGIRDSELSFRTVFDSAGLVSYNSVKWASPTEFATGGLGFTLQWWDLRKPGGATSQLKGNWFHGSASGIVHSIDIHPSRKHTCLAGGSLGTVFAWDLRWPQQPVALSGTVMPQGASAHMVSESEVWEVQCDLYVQSSNPGNISSSRMLPVMICSEDGILAVAEQGEEPTELLAEPCAINTFDIDKKNPSDVICSLEWESIAILTRP